MVKIIVKII